MKSSSDFTRFGRRPFHNTIRIHTTTVSLSPSNPSRQHCPHQKLFGEQAKTDAVLVSTVYALLLVHLSA